MKLAKMIDFKVSDILTFKHIACGCGLCYRPGGQKATSRGLCGWFSIYTEYLNSQEEERPG